jgi:dephospho-CoA kinase
MDRDQKTKKEVMSVINNQLPDLEKINQSNFVIYNNIFSEIESKSLLIHNDIINRLNK